MKRTDSTPAPTTAPPSLLRAFTGYLIGALGGLALLFVLSKLLNTPPAHVIDELPHLTILAEFDDLARPEVRAQLCELHRQLVRLEAAVAGPLDYPIMVPPSGDRPAELKNLDALSADELARSRPYFGVSGWLTPRTYSPDLKSAVLRVGTRDGVRSFPPGFAGKVEALLGDSAYGALRLFAYSRALKLEDAEARDRINQSHGVQTAIVEVRLVRAEAGKPELQKHLLTLARSLEHPRLKSITTAGAFAHYAAAVEAQAPDLPIMKVSDESWSRLDKLGRLAKVRSLVTAGGAQTFLAATTDAEGADNRELCVALQAQAERKSRLPGTTFVVRRGGTKPAAPPLPMPDPEKERLVTPPPRTGSVPQVPHGPSLPE